MSDEYISPEHLYALSASSNPPFVIDVRSAEEYAAGHVAGAVHIPGDELAERLEELPQDRLLVPY